MATEPTVKVVRWMTAGLVVANLLVMLAFVRCRHSPEMPLKTQAHADTNLAPGEVEREAKPRP
jgi:hypothetical protein